MAGQQRDPKWFSKGGLTPLNFCFLVFLGKRRKAEFTDTLGQFSDAWGEMH